MWLNHLFNTVIKTCFWKWQSKILTLQYDYVFSCSLVFLFGLKRSPNCHWVYGFQSFWDWCQICKNLLGKSNVRDILFKISFGIFALLPVILDCTSTIHVVHTATCSTVKSHALIYAFTKSFLYEICARMYDWYPGWWNSLSQRDKSKTFF